MTLFACTVTFYCLSPEGAKCPKGECNKLKPQCTLLSRVTGLLYTPLSVNFERAYFAVDYSVVAFSLVLLILSSWLLRDVPTVKAILCQRCQPCRLTLPRETTGFENMTKLYQPKNTQPVTYIWLRINLTTCYGRLRAGSEQIVGTFVCLL